MSKAETRAGYPTSHAPVGAMAGVKSKTQLVAAAQLATSYQIAGALDLGGVTLTTPSPVVFHLSATLKNLAFERQSDAYNTQCYLPAGNPTPTVANQIAGGIAALFITYGAGGATRTLAVDLKPGSYQFPPIDQIQVRGLFMKTGTPLASIITQNDLLVSTDFELGTFPNPARFMQSVGLPIAAAGSAQVTSPYGARWYDVWATNLVAGTPIVFGAATAPVLNVSADDSASPVPVLQRDYNAPAFWPQWGPVEMTQSANEDITISNGGTNAANVWCRFWLEP